MEIVKRGLRGGALVLVALVVAVAASAQPPGAAKVPTLKARVAFTTKQKEELVTKFLEALGPAIREQLAAGRSVALPGVGVFSVVRVAEHRNLVEGRVVVVRATNYIEFVPAGIMIDTAICLAMLLPVLP